MDPYLEARWGTFHASMINAMMAGLNQVLPGDLEASIQEEVRIDPVAGEEMRGYRPDVAVVDLGSADAPMEVSASSSSLAVEEAEIAIRYVRAPLVVRRTEITEGDRVVTAIELLSPWK
jgi:hypothetical protein